MVLYANSHVQGQVGIHTIEIMDGCLSIDGVQEMFRPLETEELLDILLIWRYGLEVMPLDDTGNNTRDT